MVVANCVIEVVQNFRCYNHRLCFLQRDWLLVNSSCKSLMKPRNRPKVTRVQTLFSSWEGWVWVRDYATPSVYLAMRLTTETNHWFKNTTTPARLQIERGSIRQVIFNDKEHERTSTDLVRHEGTATEVSSVAVATYVKFGVSIWGQDYRYIPAVRHSTSSVSIQRWPKGCGQEPRWCRFKLKEVKSCISQVTLSMKKMTSPLVRYCKDHTILLYEAKDDTTGVSFEKNGVKKWVPIVLTDYGKELGLKEMERCKKIVYFQNENVP